MTDTRLPAPDPEKVRRILGRISASSSSLPVRDRYGRKESWGQSRLRQGVAFKEASQELWEMFRRIDRRATIACAEIAAKYSEEAAAEILSRPDLEPWSG